MNRVIKFRPPTPQFREFAGKARGVLTVWAQYIGGFIGLSLVFGPIAPLGFVAILLTLFTPIALLVMWGQSLERELRWTELPHR